MSMKPGVTHSPATSRISRAAQSSCGASCAMRPFTTPTSPCHGGAPLPSKTSPRLSSRSSIAVGDAAGLARAAAQQDEEQRADQQAEDRGAYGDLLVEGLNAVDHRVVEHVGREMH